MQTSNEHTIVAAFRNHTDAAAAAEALAAEGFARDEIFIESSDAAVGDTSVHGTRSESGIKGWFKSIFGEEEADHTDRADYESAYSQGQTLLSVYVADEDIPAVESILNRYSPIDLHAEDEDVADTTNTRVAGTASVNTAAQSNPQVARTAATETNAIPVVREELQVGKRRVLSGGVRVYSRVLSQPVEDSVSLREEHVRVDRRPVNRQATAADLRSGRDEVIEVQEFAEEPVIAKQARVVEEVRVGKDVSERKETVRDNVRRTEVKVDRIPGSTEASYGSAAGSNYAEGGAYDDTDFRSDFQTRYGTAGESYDTYAPAYQYGSTMAADPRYQGRSYSEVESDLRSDYTSRYPGSTWEKMKDSVRYGWDKVTGKTRATTR